LIVKKCYFCTSNNLTNIMNKYVDVNRVDNDGVSYIFGNYTNERGWLFNPYKFCLVNKNRGKVSGQFITSNWFNCIYDGGIPQHYVVLGIKGSFDYKNINKMMNDSYPPMLLFYGITKEEVEAGVMFKDHYVLNSVAGKKILEDETFKISEYKYIKILGEAGISTLVISARRMKDDKLYMSLPDFNIDIPNVSSSSQNELACVT